MARITQDNENYYIAKSALVLTENAVAGSAAHRYIAASVAAGTKIRVARLVLPDSHGQMIPVIDWAADLEYSQWNLRAFNTVLNEEYDSVPVYLYVRLNRKDMTDALVIYSPNEYDYLGPAGSGSGSGSGSGYDDDELMDGTYIYLKIGTLSAPSNGLRSLVYDTGKLGTAKGNEEQSTALLDSMFRLVGEYIQPQKWFEKIETNILSMMNGAAVKTVTAISDIISDISEQTIDHLKATLPTAYAVASYIKAKIEALSEVFLSKVSDDTAAGHITFNKGLTAVDNGSTPSVQAQSIKGNSVELGNFSAGVSGSKIYNSGTAQAPNWTGEFDTVVVRNKLQATTIEIQHEKHVGGKLLNTAANMILVRVTEVTRPTAGTVAYKCYFDSKDKDGRTISNMWAVDDQAILKQFAIGTGDDEGKTIASRYYWRLVTAVGTEIINGVTYNYATLSNTSGNYVGTDVPEIGDEVVQLGNQSDTNRQGAIILAAIGTEGESAPSFIGYNGINTFSLEGKEVWKLSPDDTKILADNIFIGDRTVTTAITNLDDEIAGITSGEFDVFQDEVNSAPRNSSQVVLTYIAPKAYSYLPSYDWETTTYTDHTNDILVYKDGITYKFGYVNNTYGWYIVTDSYLIAYVQELTEARQKIRDIVADDRITNDEKHEVQKVYDSVVKAYNELSAVYNGLGDLKSHIENWNAYKQAYDALCDNTHSTGFLRWIIDVVSATYTLILGAGTFSRAQLNAAISSYYEYEAKVKTELEGATLIPTGFNKYLQTITLTADNLVCQNNHGERTMYLNELGDLNIKGILNKNAITIGVDNASDFLIPFRDIETMSDSDLKVWSGYKERSEGETGQRVYRKSTASGSVDTFNPFCSSGEISIDSSLADEVKTIHSLDVMRVDGMVILDSSLSASVSETSAPYSWFTLNDGQAYRNMIVMPFFRQEEYDSETGDYTYSVLRTPTRNDTNALHLITLEEIRSLVGKRITMCNNTGQHLAVLVCGGCYDNDDYISKSIDGANIGPVPQPIKVSEYDEKEYYAPLPHGRSLTIEYKEAVRVLQRNSASDSSHLQSTTVVDIIPSLVSITGSTQPFSKDAIVGKPTFGTDNYPAS